MYENIDNEEDDDEGEIDGGEEDFDEVDDDDNDYNERKNEEIEDFEEENFDFFVHRRSDDFYVNLTYNTLEYSDKFVETFLQNYARVIQSLAAGKKPADILKELG